MYKKLLPFSALLGTLLLTGCSSSQPIKHKPFIPLELDNSIQLKKTDIRETQLPSETLKYIINAGNFAVEKHFKELDSNADFIYHGKLRVYFDVALNKLITLNNSLCYVGDCTKVYKTKDYQNFISEVNRNQDDLHSNIFKYAKEYKESENTIDNWLESVKNKTIVPNVKFRNKIIDDVALLDKISENVTLSSTSSFKEGIYGEYLVSKEKSLNTFLKNKVFGHFYPYREINYKKFKVSYSPNNKDSFYYKEEFDFTKKEVNLNNVNNLYLEHNKIYYSFIPDTFTTNDSNIELHLFLGDSGTYGIRVTNLTNKFIILRSVSLYLDDKINNLITVAELPPKAISNGFRPLTLPEGTTAYTKITNLNQVRDFGVAVSYMVDSKKETLYTEKKLKINK